MQDHHGENELVYRCYVSLDIWLKENNLRGNNECTEKTALEEWGGVYVGVRAAPEPPQIPVLFSHLTFLQGSLTMQTDIRKILHYRGVDFMAQGELPGLRLIGDVFKAAFA